MAHRVGQAMCYFILQENGQVIARTTVQPLTYDELQSEDIKQKIMEFDRNLQERIGKPELVTDAEAHPSSPRMIDVDEDVLELWESEAVMPEADDDALELLDNYISAHVLLPKGDSFAKGQVIARKRDANGSLKGKSNKNPILDTRVYEVQFVDGHTEEYAANVIAESVFAQVDDEGHQHLLLDEIIEFCKDPKRALTEDERWIISRNGNKHPCKTTKGWELCILWKDKSTSWVPLKDLKEGNPVQVAEFAIANGIAYEPAFAWWKREALKKRDRILSAVKTRYLKRMHKFGIQMPKTIHEAFEIDHETGTDLRKAIKKEMKNVECAFEFLEPDTPIPIGYRKIPLHFVFDVKMDFMRKARLVAAGHLTDPLP